MRSSGVSFRSRVGGTFRAHSRDVHGTGNLPPRTGSPRRGYFDEQARASVGSRRPVLVEFAVGQDRCRPRSPRTSCIADMASCMERVLVPRAVRVHWLARIRTVRYCQNGGSSGSCRGLPPFGFLVVQVFLLGSRPAVRAAFEPEGRVRVASLFQNVSPFSAGSPAAVAACIATGCFASRQFSARSSAGAGYATRLRPCSPGVVLSGQSADVYAAVATDPRLAARARASASWSHSEMTSTLSAAEASLAPVRLHGGTAACGPSIMSPVRRAARIHAVARHHQHGRPFDDRTFCGFTARGC